MDAKQSSKPVALEKKKLFIIIISVVVALALAVITVLLLTRPQRSAASYCAAYKEEDGKLASANGTSYGVKVFSHKSSNAADFVNAFSRLEQVAPDEIRADVKTLRQVFQKIDADPSQAISAGVGGLSAEQSVTDWTKINCK